MGITDRYRKPDQLPPIIPVFPLKGCILLPRATLPLSIFEPRYLAMVDTVLAGHRLIGIIQPQNTASEAPELPEGKEVPLRQTGGVGRLTSFSETDDGRVLI